LKGGEINRYSRIVAVVDVFDALATKRVYKEAWPQDTIVKFLKDQKGRKFDPEIVYLLLANLDQINELIKDLSHG
jgi:response regulator RpfG family c-di-GMP phosphodiesterase